MLSKLTGKPIPLPPIGEDAFQVPKAVGGGQPGRVALWKRAGRSWPLFPSPRDHPGRNRGRQVSTSPDPTAAEELRGEAVSRLEGFESRALAFLSKLRFFLRGAVDWFCFEFLPLKINGISVLDVMQTDLRASSDM